MGRLVPQEVLLTGTRINEPQANPSGSDDGIELGRYTVAV